MADPKGFLTTPRETPSSWASTRLGGSSEPGRSRPERIASRSTSSS